MNYPGSKTLHTQRLILRPFCADDAPQAYANWMSDHAVTRYLTWQPHTDIAFTRRLLASWEEEGHFDDVFHWAIVLRESGEAVGDIGVVTLDKRAACAGVGYCLSRPLWGRGIMTEALSRVISFLFAEAQLFRISARYALPNAASGRVLEKCGMKREGILRGEWCLPSTGERTDICVCAILREEWRARRAAAARWVNEHVLPEREAQSVRENGLHFSADEV